MSQYLKDRTAGVSALSPVSELLQPGNTSEVGLILTDRLLNLPSELVPPMYGMLLEEISWAVDEKEPYSFTHYLILSKTYVEIASALDQELDGPKKKKKKHASNGGVAKAFYFHPEDELLQQHALVYSSYPYANEASGGNADSKRAFQDAGIKPQGHLILIEAPKFEPAVKAIERGLQAAST